MQAKMVKRRSTATLNSFPTKKVKKNAAKSDDKQSDQSTVNVGADEPFTLEHEVYTDPYTGKKSTQIFVRFNNSDLIDAMRKISNDSEFYEEKPRMNIQQLRYKIQVLRNAHRSCPDGHIKCLLLYLETHFKSELLTAERMLASGVMDYESLWYVFYEGRPCVCLDDDKKIAGTVASISYNRLYGYMTVTIRTIMYFGDKGFQIVSRPFYISGFRGTKSLSTLPIKVMSKEDKEYLTTRGKKYCACVKDRFCHMYHDGVMIKRSPYGVKHYNVRGRIILDTKNFNRYNPNYSTYNCDNYDSHTEVAEVTEEHYYMMCPFIPGYNLSKVKLWGEFSVENVSPINYNDKAFDCLEVPGDKFDRKSLILALITHRGNVFTDVIQDKSGGLCVLLQGKPGVGKTLTAEATAEILHVPLYTITVGDLGTEIGTLEKNLNNALELGQEWNAVILLDEADIFLEKRDTTNILRNAMVGVFLRLLEYHDGIIFLTTNRISDIDEAVISRMSMIFNYPDLDFNMKVKIWTNLLKSAGINIAGINVSGLALHNLNGRQIKSTIRLAQSLALSKGEPVSESHLDRIIEIELDGLNR